MSGHRILADLEMARTAYGAAGDEILTVGSGAPDGNTNGLLYLRTDGTAEDTRLYLRGDPDSNDWTALNAP